MEDDWEMLHKQLDELPVGIEHAFLRKEMEKFYPKWKLLEERLNTHFAGNIEAISTQNKEGEIRYDALYKYAVSDKEKFGDDIDNYVNLTFSKNNIQARKNIIKECKDLYELLSQTLMSYTKGKESNEGTAILIFFDKLTQCTPSSAFLRLKEIFESYERMSEQVKNIKEK